LHDGPVQALDQTVHPPMVGFRKPVFDVIRFAGHLEGIWRDRAMLPARSLAIASEACDRCSDARKASSSWRTHDGFSHTACFRLDEKISPSNRG
jgi:hypothetical protein